MKFTINPSRGSAYLFVLGIIVVALFILMASMRRSVESSKQTFSIEEHTISQTMLDSCVTYVFHVVKTWPFHQKPQLAFEDGNIEITGNPCNWKLVESDSRRFVFEITSSFKKITKTQKILIDGDESYPGIQWRRSIIE